MSLNAVKLFSVEEPQKSFFSVAYNWSKEEEGVKKLFVKPYYSILNWVEWADPGLKKSIHRQKEALDHVKTIFSWIEFPDDLADMSEKVGRLKKSITERDLWGTIVNTSKVSEYGFSISDFCLGSFNPLAPTKKVYFSYNYANTLSGFGVFENISYLITSIHRFILEFKHVISSSKGDPKYTLAWMRIVKKLPTFFLSLGGIFFFFLGVCLVPKVLYLMFSTIQVIMQIAVYFFKELRLSEPIKSVDNFIAFLPKNQV